MRFKLIIFDLDDTLVDTTNCLVPRKLFEALQAMVEAGLAVSSVSEAFKRLKEIDKTSLSGKDTLRLFLEEKKAEPRFLEIGLKEYYEKVKEDFTLVEVEGASLVLSILQKQSKLVIVSWGMESQQLLKMKEAGIKPELFEKIIFIPDNNKKPAYQQLLKEFNLPASEILVCGDRFNFDLQPAQELGMKTCHLRWGRGMKSTPPKVDFSIGKLKELLEIVS